MAVKTETENIQYISSTKWHKLDSKVTKWHL